jgi:hypothetical protein
MMERRRKSPQTCSLPGCVVREDFNVIINEFYSLARFSAEIRNPGKNEAREKKINYQKKECGSNRRGKEESIGLQS